MPNIEKIYHPYLKWEDFKAGMWSKCDPEKQESLLQQAIDFTGNADLYGKAMLRVIVEWPITCEHNLTDTGMNRKAFIGHAAVCLELGIPEYITRMAWNKLTDLQRVQANDKAKEAIAIWETKHLQNA